MYKLCIDYEKCEECEMCDVILPGFKSIHGGMLLISKTNIQDEEIRAAADRVKAGCPNGAILFKVHK